jgi:ATP-dependent Clp protease ATP-binding subunit ClpX
MSTGRKAIACSFCGRPKQEVNMLIAGITGHICDSCVAQAETMVSEELKAHAPAATGFKLRLPTEIKAHLDTYVIGHPSNTPFKWWYGKLSGGPLAVLRGIA